MNCTGDRHVFDIEAMKNQLVWRCSCGRVSALVESYRVGPEPVVI